MSQVTMLSPQDQKQSYEAMPVILENGRKVFGPLTNFVGPRPTYHSELYVTRVPKNLDAEAFLMWLHRIGRVFEFRLMMDSGNATRGYGFIRFCSEKECLAAFELIKFLFVGENVDRLCVYRSQGKNRLFISGIPRQIPINLLEEHFKQCFPLMHSCTAYPALRHNKMILGRERDENRGFAFIEFDDHEEALQAKKSLTPGRVRMWGVDMRVQWAKPKEEMQAAGSTMKKVNTFKNSRFPNHITLPNDYCAKLRLFCLANNLFIPIVVYGASFPKYQLQYAGILLLAPSGSYSMFLFEILVTRMSDIHLAICELTAKMLERESGKLEQHALFRILNDAKAELVHTVKSSEELDFFNLPSIFKMPKAITDLSTSLQLLADQNAEKLLVLYKRSFLTNQTVACFNVDTESPYGTFYSILPKFRSNTKLNNNFNDMEINLLQNPAVNELLAATQDVKVPHVILPQESGYIGNHHVPKIIEIFTVRSQHGYGIKNFLRYVDLLGLEQRTCYQKEQRVNSNPIFIAGHSYQKSIYN